MPSVNQGPASTGSTNTQTPTAVTGASSLYTYATLPNAALVPSGTFAYTTDEGMQVSNGVAWIGAGGNASISVQSSNGSIVIAGSPGAFIGLMVAAAYAGALNVLSGVYTFSALPPASSVPNQYAATSDQGAVFSNGISWQVLFNPTTTTLAIATGTPLPPGINGTAYTDTLTATLGTAPYGWAIIYQTGTSTFTLSATTGVLASASPVTGVTTLWVQVTDATGASAQKVLSITIAASASTPAATPTFSPVAGPYSSPQTVTISCSTASPTIYYTTNGSNPTTSSSVYTGPLTISPGTTLKALATASGFTNSAIGTATYAFENPIGGILSYGGTGTAYFESFPTFKNRIRECTCSNGSPGSNGWPLGTTLTFILWAPLAGGSTPSWASNATSGTPFKCGFIGTGAGTFTVTGTECTIANIVQGGSGGYTTFDLYSPVAGQTFSFTIGGLSTGASDIFAYLPEYPAAAIDDPTSPAAITNEAVALYSQLHHVQLVWSSISMYNTTQGTSTSRNTPSNCQLQCSGFMGQHSAAGSFTSALSSGATTATLATWALGAGTWSIVWATTNDCRIMTVGTGTTNVAVTFDAALTANESATFSYGTEGRPIEWYIALAVAANIGLYICLPIIEDGTQYAANGYTTQVFNLILTAQSTYPNWTGNIYIKTGNENWNGGYYTYYTINYLTAKYGYANVYDYLAYRMHAIAQIGRSVFGAAWGVTVHNVLEWQVGSPMVAMAYTAFTYATVQGWTPSADVGYLGSAPYSTPVGLTSSSTIAQIQAAVTTDAATRAFVSKAENTAIIGLHWGVGQLTYESNCEWSNSGYSFVTNLSAAINDPGMTAPMVAYQAGLLNSGFQLLSQSVIGISAGTNAGGGGNNANELGDNYAVQISTGSAVWQAIESFGSPLTLTRNVINGPGSVIQGGNYADANSASNPGFPSGIDSSSWGSPYYNLQGYIGYFFNSTQAQTLTLTLTMAGTGTPQTNVEIGSLTGFTIPYTNVPLAAGANVIGSVNIPAGPGYILFGKGIPQSTLTVSQLAFS